MNILVLMGDHQASLPKPLSGGIVKTMVAVGIPQHLRQDHLQTKQLMTFSLTGLMLIP